MEAEETKKSDKRPSCLQGLQLLIVQSIACVAVLLLALLLRVIGGDVFAAFGEYLKVGLTDRVLVSSVVTLLESVSSQTDAVLSEQVTDGTTSGVTFSQAQSVMLSLSGSSLRYSSQATPCAPLSDGQISSLFGTREDPFDSETTATHHGLDIAAEEGTEIVAMLSGTVVDVDYEENGYGHHVIVQCDTDEQDRYLYAHCSEVLVEKGDTVYAGETIAKVGSTGRSTGAHLHLEWQKNGALIDPMTVLPSGSYA